MYRSEDERVVNAPVLVPYNRAHHGSLRRSRPVMMYDTNTGSLERSRFEFKTGLVQLTAIAIAISLSVTVFIRLLIVIERRLEHDVARDAALRAAKSTFPGRRRKWLGEPAVDARVHDVGHSETIRAFVTLEYLEGA